MISFIIRMPAFAVCLVALTAWSAVAAPSPQSIRFDNGLAKTPPMGWNSYNCFGNMSDEKTIREIADTLVSTGMRDAGYVYLVVDCNWQEDPARDANGYLVPNKKRFPSGMKALADYIHSKGLKIGLHADRGTIACESPAMSGSDGYEEKDAQTWASWGIDYIKNDNGNAVDEKSAAIRQYQLMRDCLVKTGRPIVYSICCWGQYDVARDWGAATGNLWRTTFDIKDSWDQGVLWWGRNISTIYDTNVLLADYAGIGNWNDPDMLEVGISKDHDFSLTFNQVSVPTKGTYEMTVSYALAELRKAYISVNGGTPVVKGFPSSGGWEPPSAKLTVSVSLNAGPNTIKFYNPNAWAPAIDAIQIDGTTYEAESMNNTLVGSHRSSQKDASGGQLVYGIGSGTTDTEYRTHFSLWAMMAAPLMAGNDIRTMTPSIKSILLAPEIIAVDQDPDGIQGRKVSDDGDHEILAKELADGSVAVALLNRGDDEVPMTVKWSDIGLKPGKAKVRDLWKRADKGAFKDSVTVSVGRHVTEVLKVTQTPPKPPRTGKCLSEMDFCYSRVENGTLQRDRSADGNPMRLRGQSFKKGIGVKADSDVRYFLGKQFRRFRAKVGVDDETGGKGSVEFIVYGDGKKLFESGVVTGDSPIRDIDIDVSGISLLKLYARIAHDTPDGDHADWADACIIK